MLLLLLTLWAITACTALFIVRWGSSTLERAHAQLAQRLEALKAAEWTRPVLRGAPVERVLTDIQSVKFTRDFMGDRATQGAHNLEKWRAATAELPIEQTGAKMRRMMPWIAKNKLVDQAKN